MSNLPLAWLSHQSLHQLCPVIISYISSTHQASHSLKQSVLNHLALNCLDVTSLAFVSLHQLISLIQQHYQPCQ